MVPIQEGIKDIESREPGASFLYTQVVKTYSITLSIDANASSPILTKRARLSLSSPITRIRVHTTHQIGHRETLPT
jgi:hypothetical protein